jgi:hypothetical protein
LKSVFQECFVFNKLGNDFSPFFGFVLKRIVVDVETSDDTEQIRRLGAELGNESKNIKHVQDFVCGAVRIAVCGAKNQCSVFIVAFNITLHGC